MFGFFLLFLVALVGGLGIGYIVFYNRLMTYKSKIEQAESIVDESLRVKYDLIVKVNTNLSGLLKKEKSLFKDLDKIENQNISNFEFDRKLVEYVAIVDQVRQDYGEVDEDKDIRKICNEIKAIDEKLRAAKVYYNKYTNMSNEMVRKFPSNIIAKLHDFEVKSFFDGKDMQDDIVDDFKI